MRTALGGAGLAGVPGLAKGSRPGCSCHWSPAGLTRVRRERLLIASVARRALLLAAAAAAMVRGGHAFLVVVLVALDGVQAALLPWLASTPDELAGANTAASVLHRPRR